MKKKLFTSLVLFLLVVSVSFVFAASPDGLGPWADSVVDYSQGLRDDGSSVHVDRSDPLEALGIAEEDDSFNPNNINFFTLGYSGWIILKFDNTIENGIGDDLRIVETTYSPSTCDSYPEKAIIDVSSDGINWVTIQGDPVCHNGFFDLENYDLQCIQYVRITDVTNPDDFNVGHITDAYDIDGVEALHPSTVDSCMPGTGDFRTIGFWKHQFFGKGKKHYLYQDLVVLLGLVEGPYYGINFFDAQGALDVKKGTMEDRAYQHCFASMLNYAAGAVNDFDMVDTDYDGFVDMTFADAMLDSLHGSDFENNKNICDSINNMNH